jgi:hypothetical protein
MQLKQQAMVTLKSRIVMPEGTVVEEYYLRPVFKSELAAYYPYHVLGLAIIDEMRAVRESISARVNRVLSWIESIVKQKLRERELTELEAKIDEIMKAAKSAQASRAGA